MGMKEPFISEIAPRTYAINEYGLSAMYLLKGSEKSLLIDTGCGVCDLRSVLKQLTDQPVVVALTHGHLDHAGGCSFFEDIYVNEKDMEMISHIKKKELQDYCNSLGNIGGYQSYDYRPDMVRGITKLPEMHSLQEGDVFHLGGRDVEVYETPGHTRGSVVFLDRKTRILFSGDACNVNTLLMEGSVTTLLHSAEKIKSLQPFFDQNYNGHIGYAGMPNCFSMPPGVTDDVIHICRSVLDGAAVLEDVSFLHNAGKAVSYGSARVVFGKNAVPE